MLKLGNNILSSLKIGSAPIKSVYVGTVKVYPGVIRVDSGTVYGDWSYNGAIRTRTVTPWTQEVYQDSTKGAVINGSAPDQSETAATSYRYGTWNYYSDNSYRQRSRMLVYTFTNTVRDGAMDTVTENGTVAFGTWNYNGATRTRSVTYHYSDSSMAGTAQTESAAVSTDWDGSYWNGACGSNYYYIDYQKVRAKYTFSDAVTYGGYYNGESRSRRIEGSCGWDRAWRVVVDWANNGATCNAAGTAGAYDCDGTYTVKYYQQQRTLYYCFPDMSGSTNTSVEYRAGGEHSRIQVDGQCGYVARIDNKLRLTNFGSQMFCEVDGSGYEYCWWEYWCDIEAQYPLDQQISVTVSTGETGITAMIGVGQDIVVVRGYSDITGIHSVTPRQTGKYNMTF